MKCNREFGLYLLGRGALRALPSLALLLGMWVSAMAQAPDSSNWGFQRGNLDAEALLPVACTPPDAPVRAMAEWEEVEYLVVTWTQFIPTLREIIPHAQRECKVLIVCTDSAAVKADLRKYGISLKGIEYLIHPYNSVWIRDYGPNTVYDQRSDSLMLIDWLYNRPRPQDDHISEAIALQLDLPFKSMSCPPYDLVNIGGNFINDGLGTAFSSRLVLGENYLRTHYNPSPKSEERIDELMREFMGISRYVKLPPLPYDAIQHIDMHMQFLDEETLLVGQYPDQVADGPQIEKNVWEIHEKVRSAFGTPYRIVRIPMPAFQGRYPDSGRSPYLTHTNIVFLNNTVLVPTYGGKSDSIALRIIQRELPGYKVVGINCRPIIMAGGALHCITRTIGTKRPLRITHQPLRSLVPHARPNLIKADLSHSSGVCSARLWYATHPDSAFIPVSMYRREGNDLTWYGWLPVIKPNNRLYYFIEATSNSGKVGYKPATAPLGYWEVKVFNPQNPSFEFPEPEGPWR